MHEGASNRSSSIASSFVSDASDSDDDESSRSRSQTISVDHDFSFKSEDPVINSNSTSSVRSQNASDALPVTSVQSENQNSSQAANVEISPPDAPKPVDKESKIGTSHSPETLHKGNEATASVSVVTTDSNPNDTKPSSPKTSDAIKETSSVDPAVTNTPKSNIGVVSLEESTNLLKSLIGGFSKSQKSTPTPPSANTNTSAPTNSTPSLPKTKDIPMKQSNMNRPLPTTPIKSPTPSSSPVASSPLSQRANSSTNLHSHNPNTSTPPTKPLPVKDTYRASGVKSPDLQSASQRRPSRESVIVEVNVPHSSVEKKAVPPSLSNSENKLTNSNSTVSPASSSVNHTENSNNNVKRERSVAVTITKNNAPSPSSAKRAAPSPPPAHFKPVRASVVVTESNLSNKKPPINNNPNMKSAPSSTTDNVSKSSGDVSASVKDRKAMFEGQRRSIIIPKPSQSSTLRPTNIVTLSNKSGVQSSDKPSGTIYVPFL